MKIQNILVAAAVMLATPLAAQADPSTPSTPVPAASPSSFTEIDAGVWSPTLSGTVGQANTSVNLSGTLHLPSASSPAIDVDFHTGRNDFLLGYASLSNSATTFINENFVYGGQAFTFGDSVSSNLQFSTVDVGWAPELFGAGGNDDPELSFLLLVKILNLNTSLRDNTFNFVGSANYTAPVPLVGLSGRVPFGKGLELSARFGTMAANVGGVDGNIFDWRAGLKYRFSNFVLSADYRSFDFNGHDNNGNTGNLQYSGPTFQVGARF